MFLYILYKPFAFFFLLSLVIFYFLVMHLSKKGFIACCLATFTTHCTMSNGIQSVDQQFNITSPLDHGVYVAAQKLPITYVLLGDSSGLELNIYMKPVDVNATTVVVAQKADVSEDASSIVTIDNKTYWQHSYNYEIPRSTQAGSYEVDSLFSFAKVKAKQVY